jgi:hypothetical protein
MIEVVPFEADLLWTLRDRGVATLLLVKTTCLAVILTPLAAYGLLNGWRAFMTAKGAVILVGLIILVSLVPTCDIFISVFRQ